MTATHRCPGRCGRHVPGRLLACPGCTDRVPEALTAALAQAFGPSGERAREDARDWLLANPAPTALSAEDARLSGFCNHCGAEILWLTTAPGKDSPGGKRMPVDAQPDPVRGNVVRIGAVAGVLGDGPARSARADGKPLWLHHVVTCPHADRWHAASNARKKARR